MKHATPATRWAAAITAAFAMSQADACLAQEAAAHQLKMQTLNGHAVADLTAEPEDAAVTAPAPLYPPPAAR